MRLICPVKVAGSVSVMSLSQGEVEQIALMKPRAASEHEDGMLEFLEDIIGTSRLKEPIEQLSRQVEEANSTRGEKVDSRLPALSPDI